MSIEVKRERDADGTTLTATCECGAKVETYVPRGATVSDVPAPFPDDLECEVCGRWYNSCGQELRPRAEFDPADAGERWDED